MKRLRTLFSDNIIPLMIMSFALVVSYNIAFAVAELLLIYCGFAKRNIRFDIGDVLITAAMMSWKLFSGADILESIVMGIGFEAVYLAGKSLIRTDGDDCLLDTLRATVMLAAFTFIKALANYSYILCEHVTEVWPNWRGEVITRTHHEFYLTVIASLLAFFILGVVKYRNKPCAFGALLSMAAVFIAVYTEGRLAFFCSLCVSFILITGVVFEERLYRKRAFVACALVVAALVAVFGIAFSLNIAGLYDSYKNSMWSGSGGIIHNTRITLQKDTILMLKDYPLGQNTEMLTEYNGVKTPYAHNTWLDIGKDGGIIPLVLVMGFSIYNAICLFRIWRRSGVNFNKYALIAAFVGVSLYHMVEPGIKSDPMIWALEVFLGGMIVGSSKKYESCN